MRAAMLGASFLALAACGGDSSDEIEASADADFADVTAADAASVEARSDDDESVAGAPAAADVAQDAEDAGDGGVRSTPAATPILPDAVVDDDLSHIEGDEPLVSFSIPEERLISEDGLGAARWDMTLGEFRAAFPLAEFIYEPSHMVDFSALCAIEAGVERVCAVVFEAPVEDENEAIVMLATEDPNFRTPEGVGPGVLVSDAAQIYGTAYFTYNVNNESREYVEFDLGPAENVAFRPGAPSAADGFSGIYDGQGEFNETENYRPDAVIARVEVATPRGR